MSVKKEWAQANMWICHCLFLCLLCFPKGDPFLLAEESPARRKWLAWITSAALLLLALLYQGISTRSYIVSAVLYVGARNKGSRKRPIFLFVTLSHELCLALLCSPWSGDPTRNCFDSLVWLQASTEQIPEIASSAWCAFWRIFLQIADFLHIAIVHDQFLHSANLPLPLSLPFPANAIVSMFPQI